MTQPLEKSLANLMRAASLPGWNVWVSPGTFNVISGTLQGPQWLVVVNRPNANSISVSSRELQIAIDQALTEAMWKDYIGEDDREEPIP